MAVISSNEIVVGYKVVGQAELQKLAQQFETTYGVFSNVTLVAEASTFNL
jgi:hypothetical protein